MQSRPSLNVFAIVLISLTIALLGGFSAFAFAQHSTDASVPSERVQATVIETTTRSTGTRGGSTPVVRFRSDDGRLGYVEGREAQPGDRITVYRFESGVYLWTSTTPWIERVAPWGLLALAGGLAAYLIHDLSMRSRAKRVRTADADEAP